MINDQAAARIAQITHKEAMPLKLISKRLNLPYKQLYDFINTVKGKNHFATQKIDGLIFVRAKAKALYLFAAGAKIKPNNEPIEADQINTRIDRTLGVSHQVSWERKRAVWAAQQVIEFRKYNYEKKRCGKLNDQGDKCLSLFDEYVERIDKLGMELIPNPEKDLLGPPLLIRYATRFNDEKKKADIRKKYYQAWDGAVKKYQRGVFLTLTTDPKRFYNLWDANKAFQKNWNKFITYMRKVTKKDLRYICVREFQCNGRLHFHIVILGIRYLKPIWQISKIWDKYGQGVIVHAYGIHKDPQENEFVWSRERPQDAKNRQPKDYVKKYVIKGQYNEEVTFQYWIYNSRFFTNSKDLPLECSYHFSKKQYVFSRTVDLETEAFLIHSTGIYTMIIEPLNTVVSETN